MRPGGQVQYGNNRVQEIVSGTQGPKESMENGVIVGWKLKGRSMVRKSPEVYGFINKVS